MHELPNLSIKKIFVCEFITAGGFNHADLPANLVHEGALMRDALLHDLSSLPYRISTTIDARLTQPKNCETCIPIDANDDAWQIWQQQIQQADAVWLIAPETEGLLKRLTQLATLQGKLILGCGLKGIKIASEKLSTYLALIKAGIAPIPTYTIENWPKTAGEWVVKPNDGAGCVDTFYFENADTLIDWISQNNQAKSSVIQPYQQGVPASISCVIYQGRAQLLSCNKQLVSIENNIFCYTGIQINAMQHLWAEFELLAQKIAETDMDLQGYVGIDVIVKNDHSIVVVEINPRLTTSYAGLNQATAQNPAALIINTLIQPNFNWPKLQRHIVNIHV